MASNRISQVLTEITRSRPSRFVIIDAPPCLASSHAAHLASIAEQIVFVVEANRTQRDDVEESVRLLSECPRIGLVLNKVPIRSSAEFGSYYSHYYGTLLKE